MDIAFGDLKSHYESIKPEIDKAVSRVLASGWYILGPELTAFESQFAQYLGAKYAIGCASGTEAIYLALAAAGVEPGDEAITVAHTAVPTINAISMASATPVFVDIDPLTQVMDVSLVEAKITKRTKAIIPVHLYGQVVDLEPLLAIAAKHGIPVIEDCAQSTGASYQGRKSGTIGDFGAFSFYPSKNIGAFGDGGAVCTNSQAFYERLLRLRNYGQSKRYHHDEIGINSRLDEIQAAILSAQLPHLNQWNSRRQLLANRYTQGLADVVATPVAKQDHVYHLYVIQTPRRDDLQNYLKERGIGTLIHYPIPAHQQKAYSHLGYKPGSLPATEFAAQRILSLPLYPQLSAAQIDTVIEAIKHFVKLNPSAKASHQDYAPNAVPTSTMVTSL